jgi:putative tricarboxylic transport membrane protein
LKLSREGWTGLVALAASLVLFGLTLDLKANPLVPIGPGFYPRIVLGLSAALAAALVAFDLFRAKTPPADLAAPNYFLVLAVFLIFGVYVGALPVLGFRISTFAFVAALQATLEPPRVLKNWIWVGVTALVTTAVTYVLFERYLQVLLPRGRWTAF